ncbi:hypothetical protein Aph01nite_43710 [Acrocarpospora phusangensis]|uniref:Uncharacterized protein n=1 Tax=Acrocarpospora phusangensis TaxID=1070424 RepID=A0A919QDQ6_9ACTN|nr:hypothetical protein [Acrocarpospora phusangensis]GIH26061.1 hypothetical protein Aph01nite_43710 [Acrocarpospora phusangensis]
MARSLVLRRRQDGTLRPIGGWPEEHTFALSFLTREIAAGTAKVTVTIEGADGPVSYAFEGFDPHVDQHGEPVPDPVTGEPKPNYTAWRCTKVES